MNDKKQNQFTKFVITLLLISVVFIWVLYFSPGAKQTKNLKIADQFNAQILSPLIEKNAKFIEVNSSSYTGNGGCLIIIGYTETEEDLNDLKRLVESTNPPLFIKWKVRIRNKLTKEETKQTLTNGSN